MTVVSGAKVCKKESSTRIKLSKIGDCTLRFALKPVTGKKQIQPRCCSCIAMHCDFVGNWMAFAVMPCIGGKHCRMF